MSGTPWFLFGVLIRLEPQQVLRTHAFPAAQLGPASEGSWSCRRRACLHLGGGPRRPPCVMAPDFEPSTLLGGEGELNSRHSGGEPWLRGTGLGSVCLEGKAPGSNRVPWDREQSAAARPRPVAIRRRGRRRRGQPRGPGGPGSLGFVA